MWIPVGILDSNGTLDGVSFTEKFGRGNYRNNEASKRDYWKNEVSKDEYSDDEFALQIESVKKYGGFYISRYNISLSLIGKPQSVKWAMPCAKINFFDAYRLALNIEDSEAVKSHLTFGAEYDSVLEWFIKTNARTRSEIEEDSSNWGKYGNHARRVSKEGRLSITGSKKAWCTNNIYDFAGNVDEWTQEYDEHTFAVRGGCYFVYGDCYPAAHRWYMLPEVNYFITGFRATLYIK